MLLVISDADLRYIETALVTAARNASDLRGRPVLVATIDSKRLRQAAKLAVAMAVSEDIWDGAERLDIPPPIRQNGFVNISET